MSNKSILIGVEFGLLNIPNKSNTNFMKQLLKQTFTCLTCHDQSLFNDRRRLWTQRDKWQSGIYIIMWLRLLVKHVKNLCSSHSCFYLHITLINNQKNWETNSGENLLKRYYYFLSFFLLSFNIFILYFFILGCFFGKILSNCSARNISAMCWKTNPYIILYTYTHIKYIFFNFFF